jgi:3-phosphoshikimate 1-carboxyvinyltransferase
MSKAVLDNSILCGELTAPPSKSAAHRALICSFLAGGGTVEPVISSDDMRATQGVLEALKNGGSTLDCMESGSTLRFLIPVAAALGREVNFTGCGRLPSRPLDEYVRLLGEHGVKVTTQGGLPFTVSGKLRNGSFEVNGDVSSQYITGLLLALPLLGGDSAVILKTPLQSKPYVDITLDVLGTYGIKIKETDFGYLIKGNQKYSKRDFTVEGDWSQAAFFLAAGAIGGNVRVNGVRPDSKQGDSAIAAILERFGAQVETGSDYASCSCGELTGIELDASDIPDLVPIISVTAAFAKGRTVINGVSRLRYKESDRVESICRNLRALGADVTADENAIIINGGKALKGTELDGFGDHRIVMAFSVAALFADGKTVIDGAESIDKSYPSFFEDYNSLGGKANVL